MQVYSLTTTVILNPIPGIMHTGISDSGHAHHSSSQESSSYAIKIHFKHN